MRYLRAGIVAAVVAATLAVPSFASAQIDSLSIVDARLGPEGASVVVTLTYQCQPGWNAAFGSVDVAQSTGKRLNRAFGLFSNPFPGVPCTGALQTLDVTVNASAFPFKQGRAAASATLTVFDPVTFTLVTEAAGPEELRIRK
jgi:hypothetical protein